MPIHALPSSRECMRRLTPSLSIPTAVCSTGYHCASVSSSSDSSSRALTSFEFFVWNVFKKTTKTAGVLFFVRWDRQTSNQLSPDHTRSFGTFGQSASEIPKLLTGTHYQFGQQFREGIFVCG